MYCCIGRKQQEGEVLTITTNLASNISPIKL